MARHGAAAATTARCHLISVELASRSRTARRLIRTDGSPVIHPRGRRRTSAADMQNERHEHSAWKPGRGAR